MDKSFPGWAENVEYESFIKTAKWGQTGISQDTHGHSFHKKIIQNLKSLILNFKSYYILNVTIIYARLFPRVMRLYLEYHQRVSNAHYKSDVDPRDPSAVRLVER